MEKVSKTIKNFKFFDIAANLADPQFAGVYYDKQRHQNDVEQVIQRANDIGCDRMLIVGGYLEDTYESVKICDKYGKGKCFTTVGVHPCRVDEVEKNGTTQEQYYQKMVDTIQELGKKVVAIGECGLDYDRFDYCGKELQLKHFPMHFDLAQKFNLPMYLHNRNTGNDFFDLVKANRHKFPAGIVHSFTGTSEELQQILELDLYVGINGCSLKTEENLENVKKIPLNRLMIETDAPYCEIRNSHASSKYVKTKFKSVKKEKWNAEAQVKGRCEPCNIIQVLEVLEAILDKPAQEIADACYENTLKFFQMEEEEKKEQQEENKQEEQQQQ